MVPRLYSRQANWLSIGGFTVRGQTSRDSNRAADKLIVFRLCCSRLQILRVSFDHRSYLTTRLYGQAARAISTGQLNASQRFHTPPINVVVSDGPLGSLKLQGDLILKEASRLDAFSGYPVRT